MNPNTTRAREEQVRSTTSSPMDLPTLRQQRRKPRLYAPLLSLLTPVEDNDNLSEDLRPTQPTESDRGNGEAPLLEPVAPLSNSHGSGADASRRERVDVGRSAFQRIARCWTSVRSLYHDRCADCRSQVPPAGEPRRLSPAERAKMTRYESVDTYEPESMLYKDHLETRSHEPRWFMWVFVLVLGIGTSVLSVTTMTCLHLLNSIRYELIGFGLRGFTFADAQRYPAGVATNCCSPIPSTLDVWAMLRGYSVGLYGIEEPQRHGAGYLMLVAFAVCTSTIASAIIFLVPESAGSGIPEVQAYLNGVAYPMMRNARVLVAKLFAVVFSVASGVCTGHYGPLMLTGAMLGAQVLQRRRGIRCYHVHFVDCFRNPRDRRVILIIGAAAGLAASCGVSVGGLLVIIELLSAVLPVRFALYVFAACLLSTLFTQVYWSYWASFDPHYRPHGGLLLREAVVFFHSHLPFGQHATMNLMVFIPVLAVGLLTGACAVLFVRLSWVALHYRRRLEVWLGTKSIRYILPIAFTLVYVSLQYWTAVLLTTRAGDAVSLSVGDAMIGGDASSSSSYGGGVAVPVVCRPVPNTIRSGRTVTPLGFYGLTGFLCPAEGYREGGETTSSTGAFRLQERGVAPTEQTMRVVDTYASLAFGYADSTVQTLLSQRTETFLPWQALLPFTIVYFFFSAMYSGLALCGDTLLPSLVIGAAVGRCVGLAVHTIAVACDAQASSWADPGVFALFGAGGFVSATSGLSFGVGALLMESTADFRHLLPLMLSIAVARCVLTRWTRDLHTMFLEARAVPLLNADPYLKRYSLLDTRHVMHSPVIALPVLCALEDVVRVLRTTSHHGFPVISLKDGTFKGIVSRMQLKLFLWHMIMTDGRANHLTYEVMQRVEDHIFHSGWEGADPTQFICLDRLQSDQVSLYPYVDTSAFTALDTAALPRTYKMFTTLGLRHLVVVDRNNYAVGMITRKDLIGDRLSAILES